LRVHWHIAFQVFKYGAIMLDYRFFNCLLAVPQDVSRFSFFVLHVILEKPQTQCRTLIEQIPRSFNRVTLWSCYSLQKVFLKAHKILNAVLGELWRDECRVIWETLRKRILLISEKYIIMEIYFLRNESWKISLRTVKNIKVKSHKNWYIS